MESDIKFPEVVIPGKFNARQESILDYLYAHPNLRIATHELARELELTFRDVQHEVETLVASQIVKGKRVASSGAIAFERIRLTARGEREAIKERRRVKRIIIDMPRRTV